MISTWMNDIKLILQSAGGLFGTLDFSKAGNSALIAVISF